VNAPPSATALALDAFFDWYYRAHPVDATFIGVHDHDHRLPDYSARGVADALSGLDALLARFRDLPSQPPPEAEALDRALVEGFLEIRRWEIPSTHSYRHNPCVYTGEAIFGVIGLFLRPFAPLSTRVAAAVERMMAIPAFLAQAAATLVDAPRAWVERAMRECGGALALFEDGADRLIREEGIRHPRFRAAADVAAGAFREFRAYLQADLMPRATDRYACGDAALDLLIRRAHFLDAPADEIAGWAEERLAAAETHLREAARRLGAASWREALGALADRHPPVERYYARYEELWQAAREAAEAHGLVTWPDYPIRYVPQPRWARQAAPSLYFLAYRAPAAFDRIPVVDYLVTPIEPDMPREEQRRRLRATNDSVIKLNHVVHHGGLGHHVQNWNAYHRAQSRVGRIAAVDCAARIAMLCGGTMAEGWACYATDLMEEIGFLDPLERLAQAHTRLRMAARALVDVRLHSGAWTLEQAAACYRERVGMPHDAAHAEAVKNSLFPATALMYLAGAEGIHRLRRQVTAQAPGLSLRQFHDTLLSYGSVPVALVASRMLPPGTAGAPAPPRAAADG
jgi:uncharacterized protein (DUF885 family)